MSERSLVRGIVTAVLLAVVLAACSKAPPARYPRLGIPMRGDVPDLSAVSLTLSHSGGFAPSLYYDVILSGTGQGRFVGRQFVVTEGSVDITVDARAIERILDALEAMDFMHADHHCHWGDSENDAPLAKLSLTVAGRTATFRSMTLGDASAAEGPELNRLHENFEWVVVRVDEAADAKRWIGTEDEILALMKRRWEEKRRKE